MYKRQDVPIIASGGAGKKEDFLELFHHKGIDAGLAAGIFHQKLLGIRELKEYLNANGCLLYTSSTPDAAF